jgi:hypothetical protein
MQVARRLKLYEGRIPYFPLTLSDF